MKKITRKQLLYKTNVEYGDYAINHVLGCAHGCKYPCYAFMRAKRFGQVKDYEDWIKPKLVENAVDLLIKELPKKQKDIKSVHLCFATDPFMVGYPEVTEMSLEIIKLLDFYGIKCVTLTKGIMPTKKLAKFDNKHEFGISLVSLDEDFRKKYEPYSAGYDDRLGYLAELHSAGCRTWVSIEPYPIPNIFKQDLYYLCISVIFTNKIVFGKWNYNYLISDYPNYQKFYDKSVKIVTDFCELTKIECHIKDKTLKEEK